MLAVVLGNGLWFLDGHIGALVESLHIRLGVHDFTLKAHRGLRCAKRTIELKCDEYIALMIVSMVDPEYLVSHLIRMWKHAERWPSAGAADGNETKCCPSVGRHLFFNDRFSAYGMNILRFGKSCRCLIG